MLLRSTLTCVLVLATTALGDRPRVVVVKSSALGPYAQVVAGFSAEAKASVEELTLEEADSAPTFRKLAETRPALVLAIGPAAAVGARRQFQDVPVLFVMVPSFEKYELEGQNTTGIALTSDLSLELTTLRAVLPSVKRVGVVEDPRYSKKLVDEATTLAAARGLTVVPLELDSPTRLDKLLQGPGRAARRARSTR